MYAQVPRRHAVHLRAACRLSRCVDGELGRLAFAQGFRRPERARASGRSRTPWPHQTGDGHREELLGLDTLWRPGRRLCSDRRARGHGHRHRCVGHLRLLTGSQPTNGPVVVLHGLPDRAGALAVARHGGDPQRLGHVLPHRHPRGRPSPGPSPLAAGGERHGPRLHERSLRPVDLSPPGPARGVVGGTASHGRSFVPVPAAIQVVRTFCRRVCDGLSSFDLGCRRSRHLSSRPWAIEHWEGPRGRKPRRSRAERSIRPPCPRTHRYPFRHG